MTSARLSIPVLILGFALVSGVSSQPDKPDSKPATNLDYWLGHAGTMPATTTSQPSAANPLGRADRFSRPDALPGVVVLSDDQVLPGGIFTTRDKNWEVYVAGEKRHGPFVLHERTKGEFGQTLKDLIYVKSVIISRRAMEKSL